MSRTAEEPAEPDASTAQLVASQIGRMPRAPWRVCTRCTFGRPAVISSPPVLSDGSRFPTLHWLTCPWLIEGAGALESQGAADDFSQRAAADPEFASALASADEELRRARAAAHGGPDPCGDVGLAGQRDPLGVKCLHAHVALALAGISDPIGQETLARVGYPCEDDLCARKLGATT